MENNLAYKRFLWSRYAPKGLETLFSKIKLSYQCAILGLVHDYYEQNENKNVKKKFKCNSKSLQSMSEGFLMKIGRKRNNFHGKWCPNSLSK